MTGISLKPRLVWTVVTAWLHLIEVIISFYAGASGRGQLYRRKLYLRLTPVLRSYGSDGIDFYGRLAPALGLGCSERRLS